MLINQNAECRRKVCMSLVVLSKGLDEQCPLLRAFLLGHGIALRRERKVEVVDVEVVKERTKVPGAFHQIGCRFLEREFIPVAVALQSPYLDS